ncbi:MAG TPA: VWA domain-containing protein [Opitutaceae bacterium]|nr:VWA domain-containing protein [Opitutaceae bacterium]
MGRLVLHDPLWLAALLALPLLAWLRGRRHTPVLLVPFAAAWHRPSLTAPSRWPMALGFAGLALLIGALARPQRVENKRDVRSQGYDIMLCVDVSGSMRREDADRPGEVPSRIQMIKPIIQGFIDRRPQDRIGLVLFGRRAYTLAPLTFDHGWISRQLARIKIGMIDPDGTVIGDGLGTALNRLDQEKRLSQGHRLGAFVVLLTDGGESIDPSTRAPLSLLPPLDAAKIAREKHIPIYTIGVGRDGWVWEPDEINGRIVYNRGFSRDVDPELLKQIADQTGGEFYRAEDKDTIEKAFNAIDRAQKIEFQAKSYLVTTELFGWLAVPGLLALAAAAVGSRFANRNAAYA